MGSRPTIVWGSSGWNVRTSSLRVVTVVVVDNRDSSVMTTDDDFMFEGWSRRSVKD